MLPPTCANGAKSIGKIEKKNADVVGTSTRYEMAITCDGIILPPNPDMKL
jgi:hypothetical protein